MLASLRDAKLFWGGFPVVERSLRDSFNHRLQILQASGLQRLRLPILRVPPQPSVRALSPLVTKSAAVMGTQPASQGRCRIKKPLTAAPRQ